MNLLARTKSCGAAITRTSFAIVLLIYAGFTTACAPSGVGDPCRPEVVPEGGFNRAEVRLETSSVQCRTRVCMVYHFQGNPYENDPATQKEADERIYCTCRCAAPAGSTATTCKCPTNFDCLEVFATELGGNGIRGSYCVRHGTTENQ